MSFMDAVRLVSCCRSRPALQFVRRDDEHTEKLHKEDAPKRHYT
jgi:hypothetical protein